ncbi:hypothetical protein [Aliarcobacter lanthieri]|uniref:hypothetical protein n=1 Tax=Aliarcobacter lanthieri TaxID=1355374 RepID=UPI003AAABBB3
MREFINRLKTPEISGKKIGFFRLICSISGGLIISYLGISFLTMIMPFGRVNDWALFFLIISGFIWAFVSFWISLSSSKYIALLRSFVPSFILAIVLIILYNI